MNKKHLVIIVDDDNEDQILTTTALKTKNDKDDLFEIVVVSSPEEMIEKIKNKEIGDNYSPVILLDIKMPGKDGFDALKMIREDPDIKHLPVVILSSTSSAEDILKSYNLGANSFISKKIDFDKFIEDMIVFKKYWFEVSKKP